ncbi:MAG: septum formation initiator family protein [Alphaproteobacteria bacterium]|nr:MAG: septum formation initiator family protein [Alphaproteobacteria bacterium]TAF77144.1 MAG: septum formation initiator family protein [Alphaproteobacteria bacterium]
MERSCTSNGVANMSPMHNLLAFGAEWAQSRIMVCGSTLKRIRPMKIRTIIGIAVLCYVAFHTLHGAQGINGFLTEEHKQAKLRHDIQATYEQRMRLEHRIDLLTGKEIDEDLLEELAKRQLMMAKSHEIMMVH